MSRPDPQKLPLYYRYTAPKLFSDISFRVRKKIFQLFMETVRPGPTEKVLDIGATCVADRQESNFFEQMFPYPQNLTAVGVEDMSGMNATFPNITFIQIKPDQALPFGDKQFDVAFSNAVLEHVGDERRQRDFVREVTRVSRRGVIAIPDRRFPIEHHSSIPFIHWLPGDAHRAIFRRLGFKELESIENLNLIWENKFRSFFDPAQRVKTKTVKTLGFPSNLLGFYGVE